ncbi:MAG: RDD family protein [gamma proteobacterium symbiont of Ctena orbiculata]
MLTMDVDTEYPRLLRRVQAVLIDSVVLMVVMLAWWLLLPLLESYSAVVKLAFPVLAWTTLDPALVSTTGGTPGHHLRGITVQTANSGLRLGIVRSFVRALVKGFTGWWAFIFVLATKRHQALHDLAVSSVVILREPELMPASERIAERNQAIAGYEYPSALRRTVIISIYIIAETVILSLLQPQLLSSGCSEAGGCMTIDLIVVYLISLTWFFAIGATIIHGWRSNLPGARKRKTAAQD